MSVTAASVINTVRDLIPDPVYDSSGNPLPTTDGSIFRSQTLLRFINDGVTALAGQCGWVVEDWIAFAVTANQPWYAVDSKWHGFLDAFQNSFRLQYADEAMTIWPKATVGGQSAWYSTHKATNALEVGFFPIPDGGDPTTTLTPGITASSTTVGLVSSLSFLAFGYLQINSEILAYQTLTGGTAGVLSRGQCGTTAATHTAGETVTHLSAWLKGMRVPLPITATTSVIELPDGFLYALQEFVLSKCYYSRNDEQAGKLHMDEFRREAKRIQSDPSWRTDAQGLSMMPYGAPPLGRLAWGNVVVP